MENRNIKILAIDDNKDNLISLTALIKEAFPESVVLTALNGDKGLELAASEDPDVILLDIVMPGLDGFEVCRKLKTDEKLSGIPVVFVTALKGDKESRIRALEAGAEAFLAKPIDESELTAQVRAMVRIKAATIEKNRERENLSALVEEQTRELKRTHTATLNLLEDLRNENEARKKSEEALRESQAILQAAMDQSPAGIAIANAPDGKLRYVNDAGLLIRGGNRQSLVNGIGIDQYVASWKILDLDGRPLAPDEVPLARAVMFGETCNREFIIRRGDGDDRIVNANAAPIFDETGKTIAGIVVFWDITAHKMDEQKLRESESKMRLIVEGTPYLFFYTQNTDAKVTYISPSVEKITGRSVDEWLNQSHWFCTENEINENAKKITHAHLRGEFTEEPVIVEVKHADNHPVLLEAYESPIMADGVVVGLQGVAHDITERKRAEDAVLKAHEQLEATLNALPDLLFEIDRDGRIYDFRAPHPEQLYAPPEMFLGKTMREVLPEEASQILNRAIALAAETGMHSGTCYSLQMPTGLNWFEVSIAAKGDFRQPQSHFIVLVRDVTERKRAEENARISNLRYEILFAKASDGIMLLTTSGKVVDANESFARMHGYSVEEVVQLDLRSLDAPESAQFIPERMARIIAGETLQFEAVHNHKDGHKIFLDVTVSLLTIGDEVFIQAFHRDISERKQMEQIRSIQYNIASAVISIRSLDDLYESVRRELGTLIDTRNFFVAFHNENTGMLSAPFEKDEKESIPEWPAEKSLTGYLIKIKTPLLLRKNEIEKLAESGVIELIGTTAECWLGVPLIIEEKATGAIVIQSFDNPNAYDRTSVGLMEIVAHELSIFIDRKKSEETALKLSRAVIQSPASIIITDRAGIIEYVNPRFSEITGYSFEETIGRNPRILNSGHHSKKFFKEIWDTILSGNNWFGEFYNRKKNGEFYWDSSIISPITGENGEITHFVAVQEDITEKKKMVEELIVAKDKAEEMMRVKSSFFANMSHELRTPLIGVLGFSEILESELEGSEDLARMARTIKMGGERLMRTLNFILDISKLEAGKIQTRLNKQDIIPLLREAVELFSGAAAQKQLHFSYSFPENAVFCEIDPGLFGTILSNLVNNAIRFTDTGSVSVRAFSKGGNAVIEVSDTGIGISADQQTIIWEEFRQASEGFNRSYEGTGLGLTIAKKYTELMGGSISLESKIGAGSTFRAEFPECGQQTTPLKEESTMLSNGKETNSPVPEQHTILYVEDDPVAIDFVSRLLKDRHQLAIATNGADALKMVAEKQYDAIFMDINLRRGLDGLQLTEVIRQMPAYKGTPIIAVTAFAMEIEKAEFLSRGMTHYISKPFNRKEFWAMMDEVFKPEDF